MIPRVVRAVRDWVCVLGVLPSDDGRSGLQGFGENARKGYEEGCDSVYDPRSGQEKD